MPACDICGESAPEGTRVCPACGTSLPEAPLPTAAVVQPPVAESTDVVAPPDVPPGGRFCPSCRLVYGADYTDAFCVCGVELVAPSEAPTLAVKASAQRPPAGTPMLTLYGPDRQPLHWFPLTKDVTLLGRLDAVAGVFPDVDFDEWLDRASARKVSRQHALVLRRRAGNTFALRPLAGNTGTQLEGEMVLPQQDYPLQTGTRLILGGVVRLKFEIA